MKSLSSTLAIIALVTMASFANAQGQAKSNGIVAVLDVAKIFKEHEQFNAQMERLKNEVTTFDNGMKAKAEGLKTQMENAKNTYAVSSQEFKNAQAAIAKEQANLQITATQKRQEILGREAKLYLTTYQQIQSEVAKIAGQYNISLVLRYDSEKINQNDRASVIKGVNRAVVYQKELDLTNMLLGIVAPNYVAKLKQQQQKR